MIMMIIISMCCRLTISHNGKTVWPLKIGIDKLSRIVGKDLPLQDA